MRRSLARLLPIVLILALPRPGAAQGRQSATVEDGGRTAPGVDVFALVNGQKRSLGRTDAGGEVAFDLSILDRGKGVDTDGDGQVAIEVYRKACVDGRIEVILAVEGAPGGECADPDAPVGEGCRCTKIGAFVPTPGGTVTIDVGQGVANPVRVGPTSAAVNWNFGAVANYQYYGNWEDVARGAAGKDATIQSLETGSSGFNVGGFVEYEPRGWPFAIGTQVTFGKAPDVDYALVGGGTATGSTKVGEVTPYVSFPFWTGPVDTRLTLGSSWLCNKIDFDVRDPAGGSRSSDRMEHNWNPYARIEIGIPLSERVKIYGGFSYSSNFSGNDADSDLYGVGARVLFRPWKSF